MKLGLLLCSLLAAAPAFAQNLVAYEGGTAARLSERPCSNEQVLGQLDPQLRPAFRDASVVVNGQTFSACWGPAGSAVYLLYEDGDEGLIPAHKLKPEMSV